jgi:hypothetical protein
MKGKIFNAQEVQAIIAGNKTQFREVIKKPTYTSIGGTHVSSPYIKGSEIFVKEGWGMEKYGEWGEYEDANGEPTRTSICYKSDGDKTPIYSHWNAAKSMPQWASRLTLQIKEIRVERLAEISEEDAIAEGVEEVTIPIFENIKPKIKSWKWYEKDNFGTYSAIKSFGKLWNATHKKPEEKFGANPFVFVYQFQLIK